MKLTIPPPVTILDKPYGLLDLARYLTAKERRYNLSADAARSGKRIVDALASASGSTVDLLEQDLRRFAEVIESPSCGWGQHEVTVGIDDPRGATRRMTRRVHASTADYLPLIDAVATAAKALPPLADE